MAFSRTLDGLPVEWSVLDALDGGLDWPRGVAGEPMERYYTWQRSCSRITATAMPALSIPAGFTPSGLSIGAQLVGPYRAERTLLEFSLSVERENGEVMGRLPPEITG